LWFVFCLSEQIKQKKFKNITLKRLSEHFVGELSKKPDETSSGFDVPIDVKQLRIEQRQRT
jgi:hypothetical protein